MQKVFVLVCLAALVLPSLQGDDRSLAFKNTRLSRPGLDGPGGMIRGGLEIRGPFGGRIAAQIDGLAKTVGNIFNRGSRGKLSGGVSATLPLSGISGGVKGRVDGGFRHGFDGIGGDFSGRVQGRLGNRFGDIVRSNLETNVRGGLDVNLPVVPLVAEAAIVSGGRGVGVRLGNQCGFLPPSCRAVDPRERNTVCQYTYDSRIGACVEVHVFLACVPQGQAINLFSSMQECNLFCH